MENKYKDIFKIQLINLADDLILVFPNDIFIRKIKEDLIIYLNDDNFIIKLKEYFTEDLENSIITKNFQKIIGYGIILPTSKENIAKIKIKNYWSNMSYTNKDKVWSYLTVLCNIYKNM